jgi:hypothetical protein
MAVLPGCAGPILAGWFIMASTGNRVKKKVQNIFVMVAFPRRFG